MAWEDPNWWWGTKSAEEVEGYPIDLIHDIGTIIRTRYMRLAIQDAGNPAGYVQIARLARQPVSTSRRPAACWARSSTGKGARKAKVSLGGVRRFDRRQPFRCSRFPDAALNDSDAYGPDPGLRRIASKQPRRGAAHRQQG